MQHILILPSKTHLLFPFFPYLISFPRQFLVVFSNLLFLPQKSSSCGHGQRSQTRKAPHSPSLTLPPMASSKLSVALLLLCLVAGSVALCPCPWPCSPPPPLWPPEPPPIHPALISPNIMISYDVLLVLDSKLAHFTRAEARTDPSQSTPRSSPSPTSSPTWSPSSRALLSSTRPPLRSTAPPCTPTTPTSAVRPPSLLHLSPPPPPPRPSLFSLKF